MLNQSTRSPHLPVDYTEPAIQSLGLDREALAARLHRNRLRLAFERVIMDPAIDDYGRYVFGGMVKRDLEDPEQARALSLADIRGWDATVDRLTVRRALRQLVKRGHVGSKETARGPVYYIPWLTAAQYRAMALTTLREGVQQARTGGGQRSRGVGALALPADPLGRKLLSILSAPDHTV